MLTVAINRVVVLLQLFFLLWNDSDDAEVEVTGRPASLHASEQAVGKAGIFMAQLSERPPDRPRSLLRHRCFDGRGRPHSQYYRCTNVQVREAESPLLQNFSPLAQFNSQCRAKTALSALKSKLLPNTGARRPGLSAGAAEQAANELWLP